MLSSNPFTITNTVFCICINTYILLWTLICRFYHSNRKGIVYTIWSPDNSWTFLALNILFSAKVEAWMGLTRFHESNPWKRKLIRSIFMLRASTSLGLNNIIYLCTNFQTVFTKELEPLLYDLHIFPSLIINAWTMSILKSKHGLVSTLWQDQDSDWLTNNI